MYSDEALGFIVYALADFAMDSTTSQAADPMTTRKQTAGQRNAFYSISSSSARRLPAYMLYVFSQEKAGKHAQRRYKMSIQFNGNAYAEAEVGNSSRSSSRSSAPSNQWSLLATLSTSQMLVSAPLRLPLQTSLKTAPLPAQQTSDQSGRRLEENVTYST